MRMLQMGDGSLLDLDSVVYVQAHFGGSRPKIEVWLSGKVSPVAIYGVSMETFQSYLEGE